MVTRLDSRLRFEDAVGFPRRKSHIELASLRCGRAPAKMGPRFRSCRAFGKSGMAHVARKL